MAEKHAMQTRHWAVAGLSGIAIATILSGRSDELVKEVVVPIIAGIGGIFLWDKIQSSVSGKSLMVKGANP